MMTIIAKTVLALVLIFFTAATVFAQSRTYGLHVDGLACPFCAFGIEKQLSKIAGVAGLKTDIKAGVVTLTMKDGILLDTAAAKQAVDRAGFSLHGIDQPQTENGGKSQPR